MNTLRSTGCRLMAAVFLVLHPLAGWTQSPAEVRELLPAWELMRLGRWKEAEAMLEPLKSSPDSALACQAQFAEGISWQHRRPGADVGHARECYEWILKNHPDDSVAPLALLALARIPDLDVLDSKPLDAIPLYQRVIAEYPESDAAQEASLYLAEARWRAEGLEGAREAVRELELWKTRHPHARYAAQIEMILGKLYRYPIKDYRKSVDHLSAAFQLGLQSLPLRTTTCWTVGTLAENELKDRELAVKYYTLFLEEFPRHKTAFMAKLGLKRLGAPVPPAEDFSPEETSAP